MHVRRRVIGGLVLALLLCTVPAWAQRPWADASRQAVLRADWPKVVDTARAWQQHKPDAVVAAWLLGYAGVATGDYRLATEGFQRLGAPQTTAQLHAWAGALVAQQPQNAMAHLLHGDALARSGKYTAALAALDASARLAPPTALLYDVRGVVRVLAGQAEPAETDFRRALTLDGHFADAYCSLGLLQLRQGMVAAAIASLTRALELAPEHPAARNARGVAYLHAGNLAQAVEELTQAARGNPGFPVAVDNLKVVQEYQERLAGRPTVEQGAGRQRNSIMLVVADPSQMNTATAWGSDMVKARTGQTPIVAHTPQEARAKAETQHVLLQVAVGNLKSVAGISVRDTLQALGPKAPVDVITLGDEGANRGTQGVEGYLHTTPRAKQAEITSVQLITPSQVAGLAGKTPAISTDLKTVAQRAKAIHGQGIPVAVYETANKLGLQHFANQKVFREAGLDTYTTPWQASGDVSLGLSPKFPYVSPGLKFSNAADSAASRNDQTRDWNVYRNGNTYSSRGTLTDFGKAYIGGLRQSSQQEPRLQRSAAGSGGDRSGPPLAASGAPPPQPAARLPGSNRGGVLMLAEVVDHSPVHTSAPLGGEALSTPAAVSPATPSSPPQPPELRATFLLFSTLESKR